MPLHSLRGSTHMHHDIRHLQIRYRLEHIRIQLTAGDIVNDSHSIFLYATTGNPRTKRIYGHRDIRVMLI